MAKVIVAVSGASGIILAWKTLSALTKSGHSVELLMTKDACQVAKEEVDETINTPQKMVQQLSEDQRQLITVHQNNDFYSPIASGTYKVDAMAIVPCSMATVAAVASGLSDTLLRRAADVTLKEGRPLALMPRETPLSQIHLENMLKLTRAGATIVAPMPAWYTHPKTIDDIEQFLVGRLIDALKLKVEQDFPRWTGKKYNLA